MPKEKVKRFKYKELEQRGDKNYNYKVIRVESGNKKNFDMVDIENFYSDMKKKDPALKPSSVAIEVMGIVKAFTLKYFKNDYFYDLEDYLKGKVHDPEKFDNFEYFDIIVKKLK